MTLEAIIAKAKGDTEVAIEDAIRAAYEAGVRQGRITMKMEVVRALSVDVGDGVLQLAVANAEPDMFVETNAERVSEDARRKTAKRAPKGLTKRVLRQVFNEHPEGLKMEQVQDAAVEINGAISRKTVYNELYRRTEAYVKGEDGLWRPRSPVRGGKAPWITAQPAGGLQ
jgi:hypothetical protein